MTPRSEQSCLSANVGALPWEVLHQYLRLHLPETLIFRYSCERCFENLWAMLADKELPSAVHTCCEASLELEGFTPPAYPEGDIIILYDGIPAKYARPVGLPHIQFDQIFSPIVLYALLISKWQGEHQTPPSLIAIDPQRRSDNETSFAISRILSPRLRVVIGDETPLLGALSGTLYSTPTEHIPAWKIKAAKDQIRLLVNESGSRHAVSNLIGPLLFGFTPPDIETKKILSYLAKILNEIGMIHPSNRDDVTPPETPPQSDTLFPWVKLECLRQNRQRAEVILIDDQFLHGWGQIVCRAVGADIETLPQPGLSVIGASVNNDLFVSATDSAEWLLQKIERFLQDKSDHRFKLRLGLHSCDHEILLLDLRLFENVDSDIEEHFLNRLVSLAKQHLRSREDLPWCGFTKEEIEQIEHWLKLTRTDQIETRQNDKRYLHALTMLPRLLALIDLSLPIVIFSSSGQREITELLKPYGNILTVFEKPRFFGYLSEDILPHTREAFQAAIEKASALSQARKLCRAILEYSDIYSPTDRTSFGVAANHFELYLDESGRSPMFSDPNAARPETKRFVISGILVAYAQESDVLKLKEEMARKHLRWWPERPLDPYIVKEFSDQVPAYGYGSGGQKLLSDNIVDDFLSFAGQDNVVGVCLEMNAASLPVSHSIFSGNDIFSPYNADNRYRHMLFTLLELLLFDFLPSTGAKPGASISVFVATRSREQTEFKGGASDIQSISERYGLYSPPGNSRVITIDASAIYPIICEVSRSRPYAHIPYKIHHARGVRLYYARDCRLGCSEPEWQPTRHQHYIADVTARELYQQGLGITDYYPWSVLFSKGLTACYPNITPLMLSARALSQGDVSTAVLSLKEHDWAPPLVSGIDCGLITLYRLANFLRTELKGEEFIAIGNGYTGRTFSRPARV